MAVPFIFGNLRRSVAEIYRNKSLICLSSRYENFCLQKRNYSQEKVAQGKIALITGGARGIGLSIAEQLLCAGAQAIVLGDTLLEDLEKACCCLNERFGKDKSFYHPLDVTKKDQMEKVFKCTKDKFGKIDVVVNNAGILMDSKWELTVHVNILGLIHGSWLGFQHMGTNNGGKGGYIINNASILGLQPFYASPVYVGTKHFVIGFTRSIGTDYFHNLTKVKAMAVCPGVTETHMVWNAKAGGLPGFGNLGEELLKGLKSYPTQEVDEVGRGVITMIKANENGSVWVSEGNEFYKVNIPDRKTFRVKEAKGGGDGHCGKKKEDPCKKKDPCKKEKKDPCKKEKRKDPCKKEKKKDPCKKEKKKDPCKKERKKDPCKKEKKDHCKKEKKKDPCKKERKKDHCKKEKKDHCKKEKKDPCKKEKKKDPCKKEKKDPCKKEKKRDPCKKKKPC